MDILNTLIGDSFKENVIFLFCFYMVVFTIFTILIVYIDKLQVGNCNKNKNLGNKSSLS